MAADESRWRWFRHGKWLSEQDTPSECKDIIRILFLHETFTKKASFFLVNSDHQLNNLTRDEVGWLDLLLLPVHAFSQKVLAFHRYRERPKQPLLLHPHSPTLPINSTKPCYCQPYLAASLSKLLCLRFWKVVIIPFCPDTTISYLPLVCM